jgi:hypothetical protein
MAPLLVKCGQEPKAFQFSVELYYEGPRGMGLDPRERNYTSVT